MVSLNAEKGLLWALVEFSEILVNLFRFDNMILQYWRSEKNSRWRKILNEQSRHQLDLRFPKNPAVYP